MVCDIMCLKNSTIHSKFDDITPFAVRAEFELILLAQVDANYKLATRPQKILYGGFREVYSI